MEWLRIIRYFAYIFEGRLLVIIAENNVKIIIVCTMMITWIRLLPSKKFGQYWFLPSKNMMGYLKLRCFHCIFCHDNQLNQTKVCNTCSNFADHVIWTGRQMWTFRMNLWGHRFSQNANQKLQGFLPYQTNKDRSTFFLVIFWWV